MNECDLWIAEEIARSSASLYRDCEKQTNGSILPNSDMSDDWTAVPFQDNYNYQYEYDNNAAGAANETHGEIFPSQTYAIQPEVLPEADTVATAYRQDDDYLEFLNSETNNDCNLYESRADTTYNHGLSSVATSTVHDCDVTAPPQCRAGDYVTNTTSTTDTTSLCTANQAGELSAPVNPIAYEDAEIEELACQLDDINLNMESTKQIIGLSSSSPWLWTKEDLCLWLGWLSNRCRNIRLGDGSFTVVSCFVDILNNLDQIYQQWHDIFLRSNKNDDSFAKKGFSTEYGGVATQLIESELSRWQQGEQPSEDTNDIPGDSNRKVRRPGARGRKGKGETLLYQFILQLLADRTNFRDYIEWVPEEEEGTFRLLRHNDVAKLWGARKENPDMNYENMSRSLRVYVDNTYMLPKPVGKDLHYRFNMAHEKVKEYIHFLKSVSPSEIEFEQYTSSPIEASMTYTSPSTVDNVVGNNYTTCFYEEIPY